ncbi:cytochrome c4 [Methylomonas sp. SURF-2]|uniref:Cytochrome c4 n=1 Tax=Methylomonas subterranea TaxID=2952225 RepID=A0ABT1TGY0_9GAMM|nr:c-type cytochrome [Methylomonas sp. SURF-2]MCQ8104708.1 cytochrome c4 [Methylomonas sp. SURF-2]
MKNIILSLAICLPAFAQAQPSSQVAWTPEQLNFAKAGDPVKGQEKAKLCGGCHGEKGISASPSYPSLAGQLPTYLYKQLQDYSNGSRQDPMMDGVAKSLTPQDAADLAAWFASLPPAFQSRSPMVYEQAGNLVKNGDRDRMLPPCEVCHGSAGKGQAMDIPALSAQNAAYISFTLKAFKSGQRHNDIYGRMRILAESLSDQEIEELGFYYQNIRN